MLDDSPDPIAEIATFFSSFDWSQAGDYAELPDALDLGEWDDAYDEDPAPNNTTPNNTTPDPQCI